MLVGVQGPEDEHAASGGGLAPRHGSHVVLAHVGRSGPSIGHTLAVGDPRPRGHRGRAGGDERDGSPADRLPAMAASIGAGLVVLGSHGRSGMRAVASVSERVAHSVPCSVLVLRASS